MATLTDARLAKAKSILESYRKKLHSTGRIEARQLEKELREAWDIGYQTFRTIIIDIAKNHPHYKHLLHIT